LETFGTQNLALKEASTLTARTPQLPLESTTDNEMAASAPVNNSRVQPDSNNEHTVDVLAGESLSETPVATSLPEVGEQVVDGETAKVSKAVKKASKKAIRLKKRAAEEARVREEKARDEAERNGLREENAGLREENARLRLERIEVQGGPLPAEWEPGEHDVLPKYP
jgi:hypothetical protein